MNNITTIGIDLAKNFIQIHGADARGKKVLTKRVRSNKFLSYMANVQKCLVGMEACGGAHHWARSLIALGFNVKLMSPMEVKAYRKGPQKNDAKDAEACAEAVTRDKTTFVSIRTSAQLDIQAVHRVRSYYVKQRTAFMNMIRGLLYEHGVIIAKGQSHLLKKLVQLDENEKVTEAAKVLISPLREALKGMDENVRIYTDQLKMLAREEVNCQKLETIDGVGPLTATAVIAKIGNGSEFKKGRGFAAFLGLVPKQASSGDKQILLGITKHGDRYLRQLLVHGGRSVIQATKRKNMATGEFIKQDKHSKWVRALVERVGHNKTCVAIANKNARMIIALLKNQTVFDPALAH